ncbi:hypothetical protein [Hymenobacter metallicola]|uniref:Uncharacterized protein n=1 Tax=Hymenobacter metallicola TaxID=2563114 RepID=A0A4Z0PUP0_9BACT|nr:hypothetical protein [Hymenobacter metallicola]TGE20996.1 hypothetical protein E5K02_24850 [Hymenobacter metallicola]
MTFIIIPHIGAGGFHFGMSRTAIRTQVNEVPQQFLRGGVEDTDYYPSLGLLVLYNDAETCEALEFTRPARVLLGAVSLLPLSKKKALTLFAADPALEQDEAGYTCYQQGIGAYYEVSQRAESIIAFRPGYYDKNKEPLRELAALDVTTMSVDEIMAFFEKANPSKRS